MEISKEDLQQLFDAVVCSMDFGSGFLDTDTVNVLRRVAVELGVSPDSATPTEFKSQYPHEFREYGGRLSPQLVGLCAVSGRCHKPREHSIHEAEEQ